MASCWMHSLRRPLRASLSRGHLTSAHGSLTAASLLPLLLGLLHI